MAEHLLLPVDGSPQSLDAVRFAAGEWPDAAVTLLNVIDPVEVGYSGGALPTGSEEWYQEARRRSKTVIDEARAELPESTTVATQIEVGRPAQTIVEVAKEGDADHIVIGSHGREGISRIILGSVAEHVVRRSPVPTTVVR
jgi:nucleotide-binding universal stress UspA family protein